MNNNYYAGIIKKAVTAFGKMFSGIQIQRFDDEGVILQTVNVPIAYSNKEKWMVRTTQDPNLTNYTNITLPRLAFEITSYTYDSSRKVNRNNKVSTGQLLNNSSMTTQYSPVPYNIEMSLYLITKTVEDGLIVMEQILPMFTPDYTISINAVPEMNIVNNVPVILNSVSVDDNYEGDFQTRREIIHTFSFTLKLNLFSSMSQSAIINHVNATFPEQQMAYHVSAEQPEDVPDNLSEDYWEYFFE